MKCPKCQGKGIVDKKPISQMSYPEFLEYLKKQEIYHGINIEQEIKKMKGWVAVHQGRRLTPKFIVNWLNRALDKQEMRGAQTHVIARMEEINDFVAPSEEQREFNKRMAQEAINKLSGRLSKS